MVLVRMPNWKSTALTTIRPSASTNTGVAATNPANAYDTSLTTFAAIVSNGLGAQNCQVVYTTFPTLTLPNSGTLTVRRSYSVTKASTQFSQTKIEYSLNSGSTWTLLEQSPIATTNQTTSDLTLSVSSGQAMGSVQIRCTASPSADNSIDATLDVYDIRVDY